MNVSFLGDILLHSVIDTSEPQLILCFISDVNFRFYVVNFLALPKLYFVIYFAAMRSLGPTQPGPTGTEQYKECSLQTPNMMYVPRY